ncbi:MAG: hypothetical protein IJF98_01180 [Firmicutes bacterium]|nr:hypothetical protein [Bacillota bacterium]MBR0031902.1 hypothetical protein [Treponema sp.]
MTEEQKEKYANFLDKVSEILGLNKPIDVLRLCAVTDEYFKPIEKRIAELEEENEKLKKRCGNYEMQLSQMEKGTCDICRETEKDKRIEELEKENAELKARIKWYTEQICNKE